MAFDLSEPFPVTARGNKYSLLVEELFSIYVEVCALSGSEKRPRDGCASRLVDDYIHLWGAPNIFMSDRGTKFVPGVCQGMYDMLGAVKKPTSSTPPQTKGMVERLNHTLCQMLSYLVADDQNKWDELLLQAGAAHNNNVSRGTGLAPNEAQIGRYPRFPLTFSEGRGVKRHQSLKHDQFEYLQVMRDRKVRAYDLS